MAYKPISVKTEVYNYLDDCIFIYRLNHPEMTEVYISKNKILYEIVKRYLKYTERAIKDE